ncbi:uncharacterized protein [Rhodnius prolixus]|uniref:uncharacterized protein n=1 Tax=Rhodnius prolixus TaxID=13249 RepID=UPI003D18DC66
MLNELNRYHYIQAEQNQTIVSVAPRNVILLYVYIFPGQILHFKIAKDSQLRSLFNLMEQFLGLERNDLYFYHNGILLYPFYTPQSAGLQNGDTIYARRNI